MVAPDPGGSESDVALPLAGKRFGFDVPLLRLGESGIGRATDALTTIGATLLRDAVDWEALQPQASSALPAAARGNAPADSPLAALDEAYAGLTAQEGNLVIVVDKAPLWASRYADCAVNPLPHRCTDVMSSRLSTTPKSNLHLYPDAGHRDEFGALLVALAKRYPGAAIEPLEEFDRRSSTSTGISAAEGADLQCAAYDAVKAADDETRVLGTATVTASGQSGFFARVKDLLAQRGGRACWDRLSAHVYPEVPAAGDGSGLGAGTAFATAFKRLRDNRAAAGDESPIWVTESGYTTSDSSAPLTEEKAAGLTRNLVNRLSTMDDVSAFALHTLRDGATESDSSKPAYGYGALDQNWSSKSRYCTLAGLAGREGVNGCVATAPEPDPDPPPPDPDPPPPPDPDPPPPDPDPPPPPPDPAPPPPDPDDPPGGEPVPTTPPPEIELPPPAILGVGFNDTILSVQPTFSMSTFVTRLQQTGATLHRMSLSWQYWELERGDRHETYFTKWDDLYNRELAIGTRQVIQLVGSPPGRSIRPLVGPTARPPARTPMRCASHRRTSATP